MAFPYTELGITISVYLGADPTADSGTWPSATDFSSRLVDGTLSIQNMGRGAGQKSASAGSCTFQLTNTDGALTPLLATSTYYGDWDVGVPVAVDVTNVGASPPYGRFRGYVAEIRPRYIPGVGGADWSTVTVTLQGKLGQLGQGSVVKSALRRTISRDEDLRAYWPMEDGADAGWFASALSGGAPLSIGSAELASVDDLPGSGPVADFTASTQLSGAVPGDAEFPHGFNHLWYAKFSSTLASTTTLMDLTISAGSVARLLLTANATTLTLTGYDSAGTSLWTASDSAATFTTAFSGAWVAMLISGSTSDYLFECYSLSGSAGGAGFGHVTTTPGRPTTFLIPASSNLTVLSMGHLAVLDAPLSTPQFVLDQPNASSGWTGETAAGRFTRIGDEEGIPVAVTDNGGGPTLGPQPIADALAVLRDAEAADHGIMSELTSAWGLRYIASNARVNLSAALTVNLSTYRTTAGTFEDVLTPIRNYARLRNEWTVSRPGGSDATATDSDSQAKRGRFDDSADANIETDLLARMDAFWRLHESTFDGLRYYGVPLDLGANAADAPSDLLSAWLAVYPGNRIDRTNHPTIHPQDTVSLVVEGYSEQLTRKSWRVALNAEPYEPWRVQKLATASPDTSTSTGRLAGDAACAIRGALNTSDTSIPFDPNFFRWTTDSAHFNVSNYAAMQVDLVKARGVSGGGELLTVSAIATTAATFVAAGALSHADNAAVTPALYAGSAANDLILVVARVRSASAATFTTPTGYTRLPITGLTAVSNFQVYAKIHSGSESNPTVTPSGGAAGDTVSAVTLGFRNVPITLADLADIVRYSDSVSNASAQDITYPAARPSPYPGCIVLMIGGKDDDWTSVATLSGFTEAVDGSTTTGNDQGLAVDYQIQTTATFVPGSTFTVTGGASAVSQGIALVLAGGYQTMTVTRAANGVTKSHGAGTLLALHRPLILGL